MRILVISDTHGDLRALTRIVEENQNADYILHLGDCEEECRALLADKPELASRFLRVRGTNDFGSSTPLFATLRVSLQHRKSLRHRPLWTHSLFHVRLYRRCLCDESRQRQLPTRRT